MSSEDDLPEARPVALVTGSSAGIGAAIALELAKGGFHVAANGTREERRVRSVMDEIESMGVKVVYIRADISKSEDRQRMLAELRGQFNRLDVLVNNAGLAPRIRTDILDLDEEGFDRIMDVNLKGTLFLTQSVARWMIELKERNPNLDPKIINISSISSYTSSPSRGEYCISKAALSMMTKVFADRLSQHGINLYEIRPGIVLTNMTEPVKGKYDRLISEGITPIRRWGSPEDVAKAVAAIAKGYFPFSTGETFNVDGGFHLRRL